MANVPEALELHEAGFSWTQIAELYKVSEPTLMARIREAREAPRPERAPRAKLGA